MTLTLERMRADVAAMIGEAPADVGDHDNLLDLGLDSMRLMNLVLGWQEAGLDLEFGIFAESQTLAEWWAAVEARGLALAAAGQRG